MNNYWIAYFDQEFAEWVATLPPVTTPADAERMLALAAAILAVGEQEAVYTVEETPTPPGFQRTPAQSYAAFLAEEYATHGYATMFDLGDSAVPTSDGRLWTPGRLAYFDAGGTRVEARVGDVGAILRELRPEKIADNYRHMSAVAPITIRSSRLARLKGSGAAPRPFYLRISLLTDIWFPHVLGLLEDNRPLRWEAPAYYDNRSLAEVHTPRLNRFLASVRRLVEAARGTWTIEEPFELAARYAPMVGETGIRLDAHLAG